jgi:energy-coupling factor transporter ATP-binding protein EcfA2
MNNVNEMYSLSIDQCVSLIKAVGSEKTILVEGQMGSGKSSILKTLAKELPKHTAAYFDCTTKDLGDISIPNVMTIDGQGYVSYAPNEEFGAHLGKPVILMLDELGKANPSVKNALLRVMQERTIGNVKLHPDSIVFATTNLGAEGIGDILPPHARNRIASVRMEKPNNVSWIEYGIENGIDHALLGWCKDNPHLFASFEDYKDPEENPYIYHPKQQRAAFVTPRSLEAASKILKKRDLLDDKTITGALIGTIGARGAMDLMAFVNMADQLPSLDSIKTSPSTAKVPSSAAAVCMVVYRTLATIEREWLDNWMVYLERLDKEAQGLFINGVRSPKYSKAGMVLTNMKVQEWARENAYLYAADKK